MEKKMYSLTETRIAKGYVDCAGFVVELSKTNL